MDYDTRNVAEVYNQARKLPAETLARWERAIRDALPESDIRTVVDLGCGTGRFTALLADIFPARVIGVEPSRKMLAQAKAPRGRDVHFMAGCGEDIPLPAGSVDLIFLSMVFHHFRSLPQVFAEFHRVLRPGGFVAVRTSTQESNERIEWLRFFPEAAQIEREIIPSRAALTRTFAEHGFACLCHRPVPQKFAADYQEYYQKIRLRGVTSLQLIADDVFQRRLAQFQAHCESARQHQVGDELIDLFVFQF